MECVWCYQEVKDGRDHVNIDGSFTCSKAKKPSGFMKPCRISDQLADFLHNETGMTHITHGDMISRVEVTRAFNLYFQEKQLIDPQDHRVILYQNDPALRELLGEIGKKLTYFNLQAVLKDHFSWKQSKDDENEPVS